MKSDDEIRAQIDAVWLNPATYAQEVHGPKFASEVNSAFYDTAPNPPRPHPMATLLAVLQAAAMLHQAHHWNTRGLSAYGDHLLFERLYTESQEFIDQVAERLIGAAFQAGVDPVQQAATATQFLREVSENSGVRSLSDSNYPVLLSWTAESHCVAWISKVIEELEGRGEMTPGIANLLEGLADKHETFVYLLRQRASAPLGAVYSYDRTR